MHESQLDLLRTRRFLPLFVTLFLGAGNDNLFKNAIAVLVLYRIAEQASLDGQVLVTVAAGIFILPFFLFSATGGQLADKLDKSILIRAVKLAEVIIMALGAVALFTGDITLLFAAWHAPEANNKGGWRKQDARKPTRSASDPAIPAAVRHLVSRRR